MFELPESGSGFSLRYFSGGLSVGSHLQRLSRALRSLQKLAMEQILHRLLALATAANSGKNSGWIDWLLPHAGHFSIFPVRAVRDRNYTDSTLLMQYLKQTTIQTQNTKSTDSIHPQKCGSIHRSWSREALQLLTCVACCRRNLLP